MRRPACGDWPGDNEPDWGKEAADSFAIEPLHQVIAQSASSIPAHVPAAVLENALSPEFWSPLSEDLTPSSLSQDVHRLRTLLVHSECIVVSAPYDSTTDFAIECIRQAAQRPKSFGAPTIHVHQMHSDPANHGPRLTFLRRLLAPIAGKGTVHWWFWPELHMYRERIVLGGRMSCVGGDRTKFAARYGVSMTHVWGEGDPVTAAPTTYTLLSHKQVQRHATFLESRANKLNLKPIAL